MTTFTASTLELDPSGLGLGAGAAGRSLQLGPGPASPGTVRLPMYVALVSGSLDRRRFLGHCRAVQHRVTADGEVRRQRVQSEPAR